MGSGRQHLVVRVDQRLALVRRGEQSMASRQRPRFSASGGCWHKRVPFLQGTNEPHRISLPTLRARIGAVDEE
jgi:hypothetical protein